MLELHQPCLRGVMRDGDDVDGRDRTDKPKQSNSLFLLHHLCRMLAYNLFSIKYLSRSPKGDAQADYARH